MERREPRGAMAATIDVRGTIVHVLAAHLGLRVHERRFQVRQILDYLDSVRHTLVVVLGDFNDWLPGPLGRPRARRSPRAAAAAGVVPGVLADRGARSDLGESDSRAAARRHAHDAGRASGLGSLSRRRRHRLRQRLARP